MSCRIRRGSTSMTGRGRHRLSQHSGRRAYRIYGIEAPGNLAASHRQPPVRLSTGPFSTREHQDRGEEALRVPDSSIRCQITLRNYTPMQAAVINHFSVVRPSWDEILTIVQKLW